MKVAFRAQDGRMYEPGLDRHEWEEMASLEDDVHTDPGVANRSVTGADITLSGEPEA